MKTLIRLLSLALIATGAQAGSYDPATNTLTIDRVLVGNTIYYGLQVRLDKFTMIGVGATAPAVPDKACLPAYINSAGYKLIALGMTVPEVNALLMCAYSPTLTIRTQDYVSYTWSAAGGGMIQVYFDATGSAVTLQPKTSTYKTASGF